MGVVGLLLEDALFRLAEKNYQYEVSYTVPTRDYFQVDKEKYFVVRQRLHGEGYYLLTAAAKMRKEV